jgi:hypothetical protein
MNLTEIFAKYLDAFKKGLNQHAGIYMTIGASSTESPMYFQYVGLRDRTDQPAIKFQSSQRGENFFHVPIDKDDVWAFANAHDPAYQYFRAAKYQHLKDTAPTVYRELEAMSTLPKPEFTVVIEREPAKEEEPVLLPADVPPTYSRSITFLDSGDRRFHIDIEITDGRLSMSGKSEGSSGQILDSIVPANKYQVQLVSLWHKWHLNDMHAGTPEQEAALKSEAYEAFKVRLVAVKEQADAVKALASMDIIEYARHKGLLRETDTPNTYQYPTHLKDELRLLKNGYKSKKIEGMTIEAIYKLTSSEFGIQCAYLKSINLYTVSVNSMPYNYGAGWLTRHLPVNIVTTLEDTCDGIEKLEKGKPAYEPAVKEVGSTRILLTLPSLVAHVWYDVNECKLATPSWQKDKEVKVWQYKIHVLFDRVGDMDTDFTPVKNHFDFYGSIAEYESGSKMEATDLANALRCHISDGMYAYMDVDQFASELGYEKPSEAIRVHKACEKSREQLETAGFTEQLMCDVLNEMSKENIG